MSFGFGFGFPSLVATSGGPSLSLNFVGASTLDPQITFTRASTATYFNSSGVLTSAAIDTPRFDYSPSTLASNGLLIEEPRTNSIRNNTMVGAVAPSTTPTNWLSNVGGLTLGVIGTGSENGISYIDLRFSGTPTQTFANVRFESNTQIVAANGQTWTSSFYTRMVAGSTTNISSIENRIQYRDSGGTVVLEDALNFVSTISASSLSVSRKTFTYTSSSASTAFTNNAIGFITTVGLAIDITLRIGLPQLELGAFPTSVIPTTTAAATRAADLATITTLTPWYNASAGTLFAEFNIPYALTTSGIPRLFTLQGAGGPSVDELIFFVNQAPGKAASFNAFTAGVNAGRIDASPAFVANTVTKAAAKYALNSRAVTANNTTPVTSATVYTIPTITAARLGSQDNVSPLGFLNGYLRRVAYYPRALADTELQGITT